MLLSVCMELHVHCNNLFTVPLSNQNQVWYWLESGQPIWGEAPTATNSFYPEMHFFLNSGLIAEFLMVIDYSTLTLKSTCTCSNTDFASEHCDVFRCFQSSSAPC